MTPLRERRLARRLFVAALVSLLCISVRAQRPEPGTLSDAIRFLGHEKSAAEQYGVILITVAKDNPGLYVRGIKLYADTKSDFDGLIAELRFDLQSGQEPAKSARFNDALIAGGLFVKLTKFECYGILTACRSHRLVPRCEN
jgi:hypothetical protein